MQIGKYPILRHVKQKENKQTPYWTGFTSICLSHMRLMDMVKETTNGIISIHLPGCVIGGVMNVDE